MEGRLLAHRRILQLIVGELAGSSAGDRIELLLRERLTLQDGQEDPGAVEAAGLGVELAVVEEFRRIVDGLPRAAADAPTSVRPAGPESMQDQRAEWDEVDEASDESFPASDRRHVADLPDNPRQFPVSAGILFGLGLGGFFDGIVLHQILQWHHMVTSAGYPPDSVENLELNTFFDGLFHAATYLFVVLGLIALWRTAHRGHLWWSWKLLVGTILVGFGIFNVVEGVVNHHLLGIHNVNETVPREQWIYWNVGFLIWGAAMIVGGWFLYRSGQRTGAPARSPADER